MAFSLEKMGFSFRKNVFFSLDKIVFSLEKSFFRKNRFSFRTNGFSLSKNVVFLLKFILEELHTQKTFFLASIFFSRRFWPIQGDFKVLKEVFSIPGDFNEIQRVWPLWIESKIV